MPRSPSDRTSPVPRSITRQCLERPSAETSWTIAGPVPDGGGPGARPSRSHRPREAASRRPGGGSGPRRRRRAGCGSRRRTRSRRGTRRRAPVPRGPCRSRGRGPRLLVKQRRTRWRSSTCTRCTSDPGNARRRWARAPRRPARAREASRRRWRVEEPDPSRVPVEPAVGHLLPVRGELGARERLGVADLGRPLEIGVLHRPVPGAQHRVAAAAWTRCRPG